MSESVRVDRWLWAARMFKQRRLAMRACAAGKVKINGRTAKPGKRLRVGDEVRALTPGGDRVLEVLDLSTRRGPAVVAQQLYADHTPPPPPEDPWDRVLRQRGSGRPTKRERRQLRRLRRGEGKD